MAVPKYQQRVGKLLFLESVRELRIQTFHHLYRERVVPTKIRHHFAEQMIAVLDSIDYLVHYANDIYPVRSENGKEFIEFADLYLRQQMQKQAIEKLGLFSRNVQGLVTCKYAQKNSISNWCKAITHCDTMLRSWMDSDVKRWGVVKIDSKGNYYVRK